MTKSRLGRRFGFLQPAIPLSIEKQPITDLEMPALLIYTPGEAGAGDCRPAVRVGDTVEPGTPLFRSEAGDLRPSPVKGEIAGIADAPDLRGGKPGPAVQIKPSTDAYAAPFPGIDPRNAGTDEMARRIAEAGILTDEVHPRELISILQPTSGEKPEKLIILAADREPGVTGSVQLLREQCHDAALAARIIGSVAGAGTVLLALPKPFLNEARSLCDSHDVEPLPIDPVYPNTICPIVASKAGGGRIAVVPLETALAGLDAVRYGRIRHLKVVTVIGPGGDARGNYRVPLGTRLADILTAVGLTPKAGDKLVAGGPMRGYPQFSADAAVEPGVDAVMLVPSEEVNHWSDAPCINCGSCIAACPVDLQVQLIGRYSEFGFFDRTAELQIGRCLDCGLCGAVCIAKRPLLQLIRLARHELDMASGDGEEE